MGNNERGTILIVDDSRFNLAVLEKILSDYNLITADAGAKTVQIAEEQRPDLIILDVMMPDMDGFSVIKKLKSGGATQDIPVIFITGLKEDESEEKGFMLGAVDYIKKPFKSAIVKARVHTHMQIVRQLRMIEKTGLVDPLTDIPNRRCFNERIEMEWKRAMRDKKPLAFLMLDVDYFKDYNDTYGHMQGDIMLKAIAQAIRNSARRPADLAARLGGEEFGVMLPDTDLKGACIVAELIRGKVELMQVPYADGSAVTSVTVSIGATAIIPEAEDTIEAFLAEADSRLYTAKRAGRNQVCAE